MKKALIFITIALLGIGLLSYPHIANYFSSINSSNALEDYVETISHEDASLMESELQKAIEYNENLSDNFIQDLFLTKSDPALADDYLKCLNVEDVMGYIQIPKINVNLPIHHGTADSILKDGVGHLEDSALPVGGAGTHCIITGHSGLTYAKFFTDLDKLIEGDVFYLHVLNLVLAYQVDQIKVVLPENTEDLMPIEGEDHVTLITCTPYGVNSHRLLVRGTRTEYIPEQAVQATVQYSGLIGEELVLMLAALAIAFFMLTIIAAVVLMKRRKQARLSRAQQYIDALLTELLTKEYGTRKGIKKLRKVK